MDRGSLNTVFVSKFPKLSVGRRVEFVFKNIGLILIVALFLYLAAMAISSFLSHIIFQHVNEDIKNIEDEKLRNLCWVLATFFHLVIVILFYFAIDQYILHNIPVPEKLQIMKDNQQVGSLINVNPKSVSITQNETFGTIPTTEYVFHIVLIIILIEMNSSLVEELHEVANIMSHKRHKYGVEEKH